MRTRTIKASNIRLGDFIIPDWRIGPRGVVTSMSQVYAGPLYRTWDIGVLGRDGITTTILTLSDYDQVTARR